MRRRIHRSILSRLKRFERLLSVNPDTYVLKMSMWGLGPNKWNPLVYVDENGIGHMYYLMEKDGTPKGRFIRQISRKEAEAINQVETQ